MTSVQSRTSRFHSPRRTGHFAVGLTVAVAAAIAAAGFLVPRGFLAQRVASTTALTSSATVMTVELVPGEVGSWLCRVGLDPIGLAAAGVTPAQISRLATDARAHLVDNSVALAGAKDAEDQARQRAQDLERLTMTGLATEQERAALTAARAAFASAQSGLASAKSAFFTAAAASLTDAQRALLAALARNTAREVPHAYRLVDRDDRSWRTLREDFANVAIAARRGEEPDAGCAHRVASANADPIVAASLSNTQANLSGLTQAWEAAMR